MHPWGYMQPQPQPQRARKSSFRKANFRQSVFDHPIRKEGYVDKQASNLLSNWQRRFFTLQGPYIKYYADKNKIQRDLKGVLDLRVDIDDAKTKDRGQFQLMYQGEKVASLRVAQGGAGAVAEAQRWVDEIRDQLELMVREEGSK